MGIYEIGNSVDFNKSWKAILTRHKNITEILENTYDEEYRKEQIDVSLEYNVITFQKANELY